MDISLPSSEQSQKYWTCEKHLPYPFTGHITKYSTNPNVQLVLQATV